MAEHNLPSVERCESDSSLQSQSGAANYNDTSTSKARVSLTQDDWIDIPNDGLGSFTNTSFLPDGVTRLIDTATGELDFSQLKLGSTCLVRNDITVFPLINNLSLSIRYLIGSGFSQYTLETLVGKLDSGSNKPYRFSLVPNMIYIGDVNTRDNPIKIQVRLSGVGTLVNAGTAISFW